MGKKKTLCFCSTKEAKSKLILNAIFENIIFFVLIFLGAVLISFSNTPLAFLYVAFAVLMLVFVLRKYLCTGCEYYGKWCHCGWGKLSAVFFKKNSGNAKVGGILGWATWGIIMVLPIISFARNIFGLENSDKFLSELIIFIPFFSLVVANLLLYYRNCLECEMKDKCGLSGVKLMKRLKS